MEDKRFQFTSAGVFPFKMFKNARFLKAILKGFVVPIHPQLMPTNRCNLSCGYCSCRDRDRKAELEKAEIKGILDGLLYMGAMGITITGGGEPLMHPDIDYVVRYAKDLNMAVGLVSNGFLLDRLSRPALNCLTWLRVSGSDETENIDDLMGSVRDAVKRTGGVDWAFSYVVTRDFNRENLKTFIETANRLRFSHVRVVSDLIDVAACVEMSAVKRAMAEAGVDDSLVIYQDRKRFGPGSKPCYISLLKPVIAPDGGVYPCCGAQYAVQKAPLNMNDEMRMCEWRDLVPIIKKQSFFDGSVCDRCYYRSYNEAIDLLLKPMKHVEFV